MIRISLKLFAASVLMIVVAVSCIDDQFDSPPINELPVGSVLTIQDLKNLCLPGNTFNFSGDSSVYAVVTMDEKSGNIYRNIFVQDNTGAANLRFSSSTGLYEGDSIRIYLKGAYLSWYNNLFQVDSLHADYNVVKQATNKHLQPKVATISEINLDKDYFQSRLVKIEDVQIRASDTARIWAPYQEYGEIFIEDTLGNSMMIRTSGYAKFAGQDVPNGFGSIIAIVGLYRETVQLGIRRTEEVDLHGPRWEDSTLPPSGSGTFADPFNVVSSINNNTGNGKWVEGYLVGVMETNVNPFVASFTPPFITNSNVIIADDPNETNLSKCLIVQLLVGDIRNAVNLVDNSSNKGKIVKLRGNLEAYFSVPGLRSTDGYWLDGDGINPDDEVPSESIFEETFTTNLGSFTPYNILGAQNWEWRSFDGGCVYMSGYSGSNNANEDWLVSPEIDLTANSSVILNIREAINYITSHNDLKVLVSSNFNGTSLPTESGDWEEMSGFNRPPGNNWTFVDSGDINISQYGGQKIHIALKYLSTTGGASTWEVSKIIVKEGN